jgi:hypothetical protein
MSKRKKTDYSQLRNNISLLYHLEASFKFIQGAYRLKDTLRPKKTIKVHEFPQIEGWTKAEVREVIDCAQALVNPDSSTTPPFHLANPHHPFHLQSILCGLV